MTSGTGASAGNTVRQAFDAAGFNAPINITTANIVTLYTAPTTMNLKGLDFVPVAIPEPTAGTLAIAGALGLALRGRRRIPALRN